MTVSVTNFGPDKVTFKFQARSQKEIKEKLHRHCLSRDLDFRLEGSAPKTYIVYAGVFRIGTIKTSRELGV